MSALLPAKLSELDGNGDPINPFEVQFAPSTLRLQTTNNTDEGKGAGRPAQQANGGSSTELSVELEFDTADEGTTESPVDVRTLTNEVRKFVLPGAPESKQAPPRVQFHWGQFVFSGVMSQLSEEHDLFSPQGVPLRSKLSIQIKEQDPKFEALATGTGANPDTGAPAAGSDDDGTGAGSDATSAGPNGKSTEALAGETPADVLSRLGLDPGAWRGIADALSLDPITFEFDPGAIIDFNPSLSLSGGLGVKGGFSVGLSASLEVSLGLATTGKASTKPSTAAKAAGFSMASAGGFTAAVNQAKSTKAASASASARAAFDAPAPAPPASAPLTSARRTAASASSSASSSGRRTPAPESPARPQVDSRATTYGAGVPLRPRPVESGGQAGATWSTIGARQPGSPGSTRVRPGSAPWSTVDDQHRPACGCHVCHPITRRFGR